MFKMLKYVFCIAIVVISLGASDQEWMSDSFGKRNIIKGSVSNVELMKIVPLVEHPI